MSQAALQVLSKGWGFQRIVEAGLPGRLSVPTLGGVSNPEAKNLEAISKAIDQHNGNCPYPAAEVRMNPFEVERLGWEEIRGVPIVPDPEIGTGRFRIVCANDLDGESLEETEVVGEDLVTVEPVRAPAGPWN